MSRNNLKLKKKCLVSYHWQHNDSVVTGHWYQGRDCYVEWVSKQDGPQVPTKLMFVHKT